MSHIRVLICCVDDPASDQMTELAAFDLPATDVSALQPETDLDKLEGRYALNGGVMCTTDRSVVGGPESAVHAVLAAASGVVAPAAGATPPHSSNGR